MKISDRAKSAADAIYAVLQTSAAEDQAREVVRIIEQAVVHAMLEQNERCTNVVMQCCSPDLDTAHKVAEEIRRGNQALLANLSSMR